MTQNIVRLDDCEEEESEVTREARAGRPWEGRRGGGKGKDARTGG